MVAKLLTYGGQVIDPTAYIYIHTYIYICRYSYLPKILYLGIAATHLLGVFGQRKFQN